MDTADGKWHTIKCVGGPMPHMRVKWAVREGEEVPIPDETGGRLLGTYVLRGGQYEWRRNEA